MASDDFSRGIEIIQKGNALEKQGNLSEALDLYSEGLGLLSSALKREKSKKAREALTEKIHHYLSRAEEIKKKLDSQQQNSASNSRVDKKDLDEKSPSEEAEDPEEAKMKGALSGAIVQETPNVKWDDVAGLETAKNLLKEAVLLPIKFPHLFIGKRTPWKGILLYGPPGTGKSYLAKAVATEAGASTFFSVSSSDLVSKFQGESERLVRSLFELARAKSPSIVFIDEIDSLCGNRSDGENDSARRIKTEFLVQMQGVGKANEGVLVLGATNTPWDLDPAIRRRFEKRIYIPLPDLEARRRMFEVHLGDTPSDLTEEGFQFLAEHSEGFSGSDISVVVRDALMEPVRFLPEATHFKKVRDVQQGTPTILYDACSPGDPKAERMDLMNVPQGKLLSPPVTLRDFIKVLKTAKPSVSHKDIERQEIWTAEFGQEG